MAKPKPWLTVLHNPARPEFLQRTLLELDSAGAGELAAKGELFRWLAVDGDPEMVNAPPGWAKGAVGGGRTGSRRALQRVLQAAADGGAPHCLYFEDDVIASRNAVAALQLIPVHPRAGFLVATFTRRGFIERSPMPRLALLQANPETMPGGFWGTQALKIPGAAVRHLARLRIPDTDPLNSGDVWLGENAASRAAPWPHLEVICPSIFQHVGARSLCWPGRQIGPDERTAEHFDPWFDALRVSNIYAGRE
jgi:hypothetical protein